MKRCEFLKLFLYFFFCHPINFGRQIKATSKILAKSRTKLAILEYVRVDFEYPVRLAGLSMEIAEGLKFAAFVALGLPGQMSFASVARRLDFFR